MEPESWSLVLESSRPEQTWSAYAGRLAATLDALTTALPGLSHWQFLADLARWSGSADGAQR